MKGWVYVISNKAMPELVKVGHSMKDPEIRAKELEASGSPYPYMVEYDMLVENPQQIEQQVHHTLSRYREGKEWFRCTPEVAINAIRFIAGDGVIIESLKKADREKVEGLPLEKEDAEKMTSDTPAARRKRKVLALINKAKACEATRQYWHALFYYGEAEKASSDTLATRLRLESEQ